MRILLSRAIGILLSPLFIAANFLFNFEFVLLFSSRIGHLCVNTDQMVRRRLLEGKKLPRKQVFVVESVVSNRFLLDVISRKLFVVSSPYLSRFIRENKKIYEKINLFKRMPTYDEERHRVASVTMPWVHLDQDDLTRGHELREMMGMSDKDWFVCFHSRDPQYLASVIKGKEFDYHSYRDCNIENYAKAMEWVAEQGGYAVRMGSVVDRELSIKDNPKIIDYASKYRSDFGDIYLLSQCKFLMGSSAGTAAVCNLFNVPVVQANNLPLSFLSLQKQSLFVPKLLKSHDSGEFLSFEQLKKMGCFDPNTTIDGHSSSSSKYYELLGVDPVENGPEDLLLACQEMVLRTEGHEIPKEAVELQNDYKRRFFASVPDIEYAADISGLFIQAHKELME